MFEKWVFYFILNTLVLFKGSALKIFSYPQTYSYTTTSYLLLSQIISIVWDKAFQVECLTKSLDHQPI